MILEEAPATLGLLTNRHTNGISNGHSNGIQNKASNNILTNGHASNEPVQRLFVLSAKSESSLSSYLSSFAEYLDLHTAGESENFAKNLSFTLGQRRTHYPYRVATIADSVDDLKAQLSNVKISKMKNRAVGYVFTGQGAQYVSFRFSFWILH